MKITLVFLRVDTPQDAGYNYGLGYIAAVLKAAGHQVDYISVKGVAEVAELGARLAAESPDLVGFSATTTQFRYVQPAAESVKRHCRAFVLCGGAHPSLAPECLSEAPALDAIVRGEGERPMLALTKALGAGESYLRTGSCWFRQPSGQIENAITPLITDLNELPFPDKESLDYQQVIDDAKGVASFIFSRGCTFRCTYCSNKALAGLYDQPAYRLRSAEKAIEEIDIDAGRFNFHAIVLDDDTVSLNKKWMREFFTMYRRQFSFPVACNVRPGTVDEDDIRFLRDAGVRRLVIGVEHGNEQFRREVLNRRMTNEAIIRLFDTCQGCGISCIAQRMVGFPFETPELFRDTVRLNRRLPRMKSYAISIFQPYPGTELGETCRKEGWLPEKDAYRAREDAVISYPGFSKEEIQDCHDVFPVLMRLRCIPLWIPFRLVLAVFRAGKAVVAPLRALAIRCGLRPLVQRMRQWLRARSGIEDITP